MNGMPKSRMSRMTVENSSFKNNPDSEALDQTRFRVIQTSTVIVFPTKEPTEVVTRALRKIPPTAAPQGATVVSHTCVGCVFEPVIRARLPAHARYATVSSCRAAVRADFRLAGVTTSVSSLVGEDTTKAEYTKYTCRANY